MKHEDAPSGEPTKRRPRQTTGHGSRAAAPRGKDAKGGARKLASDILVVLALGAGIAALAIFFSSDWAKAHLFDVEALRETLHPDDSIVGQWRSYIVFVLVGSLLVGVGLPRTWASAAAGTIYGAALGTVLGLLASLGGASVTYFAGKVLLRSMVNRRLGSRLALWRERFRENAFTWTLTARLIPLLNATMTSLVCGTLKVPIGAFTLANLIGFLPLTVVCAVLGSGAAKAKPLQIAAGIVLLVVVLVAQWIITKKLAPATGRGDAPADSKP